MPSVLDVNYRIRNVSVEIKAESTDSHPGNTLLLLLFSKSAIYNRILYHVFLNSEKAWGCFTVSVPSGKSMDIYGFLYFFVYLQLYRLSK